MERRLVVWLSAFVSDGYVCAYVLVCFFLGFDPEDVGARARCSLMFVTGDEDELVPMEVVEKLQETLNEKNTTMDDCEIQVYEHAGHAFAHHPQSDQDKIDSEIVLEQAMSWLTKHL